MADQQAQGKTNVPGAEATELRSAQWQIEREGNEGMREQLAQGDREADAANASRDRQDADYDPANPAEERIEAEFAGSGAK